MAFSQSQDQKLSGLMRQAQDGDKACYDALLKEICSLLRGFIQRRIGATEAVEDVLQEILIAIHCNRHTFNPEKPFAPWMFAIARYRMADYWRKTLRVMEDEMPDGKDFADPENRLNEMELITERIEAALARLPHKQRQAVNLLKIEGRSIHEAAKALEMTEAALKVTAHRAYKALRKEFEEDNGYE